MNATLLGEISLTSLQDTDALGLALATHLPSQATIALVGTLGAGKTRLVQSVASAAGFETADVTSPTFTLIQSYRLPQRTIYHVDTYRVADVDEFLELGIEEILEQPQAWVFVEWADRMAEIFASDALWLTIEVQTRDVRKVRFQGLPDQWQSVVTQIIRHMTGA